MIINHLKVVNFRNIEQQEIQFDKKLNIIYGQNGQGKTSYLESIYLLSLTKSFKSNSDHIFLRHFADYLDLKGTFYSDYEHDIEVRYFYSEKEGKNIFVNENRLIKYSEFIGKIPTVLLSLEDFEITYGLPAVRRKFADILLSQISPVYLNALQNLKRSLQQRNKLLSLINEQKENVDSLEPWNIQLAENGLKIIEHRKRLVEFLNERLSHYYQNISDHKEKISVRYKSGLTKNLDNTKTEIDIKTFLTAISENLKSDLQRGTTGKGPHRDDFEFLKDAYPLKSFGSQGENKTFLIALKMVESEYVSLVKKEKPILLLDDIFGELDNYRIKHLIEHTVKVGQTFITTTLKDKFSDLNLSKENYYQISKGLLIQ